MPATMITAGDEVRNRANARIQAMGQFITRIREATALLRLQDKATLDESYKDIKERLIFADGEFDHETAVLFHYGPHMREFGGDLPRHLNYSLITQIYSCFEDVVCDLCVAIPARKPNVLTSFGKPWAKIFQGIHEYLRDEVQLDFPHWEELEAYRVLRNRIVHNGGRIPPEEIIEFKGKVQLLPNLHIFDEGIVHPHRVHVERFFALVEMLCEAIYAQCNFGPLGSFPQQSPYDSGLIVTTDQDGSPTDVQIIADDEDFDEKLPSNERE